MKRLKNSIKIILISLLILSFIISGAAFLLFHTQFWNSSVITALSRQVEKQTGLKIVSEFVSGSLLNRLEFQGFKLQTPGGYDIVTVQNIEVSYSIPSLFTRKPEINSVAIFSPTIVYPDAVDSLKNYLSDTGQRGIIPSVPKLILRNIHIQMEKQEPITNVICPVVEASIDPADNGGLEFIIDTLAVRTNNLHHLYRLSDCRAIILKDTLFLDQCHLSTDFMSTQIDGMAVLSGKTSLMTHLAECTVYPGKIVKNPGNIITARDNIIFNGDVQFTNNTVTCQVSVKTDFEKYPDLSGNIAGSLADKKISVQTFKLNSGSESIEGRIEGHFQKYVTGYWHLNQIDLKKWGLAPESTNLTGVIGFNIDGLWTDPDSALATISMDQSQVENYSFNNVYGDLKFIKNQTFSTDSMQIKLGGTTAKISGYYDPYNDSLDAFLELSASELAPYERYLRLDSLDGKLLALVGVSGSRKSPEVDGWISLDSIETSVLNVQSGELQVLGKIQTGGFWGKIDVVATEGESPLVVYPFDRIIASLVMAGDSLDVKYFSAVGGDNFLELTGMVTEFNRININKLDANIENTRLILTNFLIMEIDEGNFYWQPVEMMLNNGHVHSSGQLSSQGIKQMNLGFNDLDVAGLHKIFPASRDLRGVFSGELVYQNDDNRYIQMNISGDDVAIRNYDFNKLKVAAELRKESIVLNSLEAEGHSGGSLKAAGTIGITYSDSIKMFQPDSPLNLEAEFENFDFSYFDQILIPRQRKSGLLDGSLKVKNTLADPVFHMKAELENARFDRLNMEMLKVTAIYKDSSLTFTDIYGKDSTDIYKGYGYLPFEFDLYKGKARFAKEKPMDIVFSAHTQNVPFLTNYIGKVEDITGDFTIALNFHGTPEKPVRSGNVTIKDGTIDLDLIENSVQKVHGSAIMKDNVLELVSLSGALQKPQGSSGISSTSVGGRISSKIKNLFSRKSREIEPNFTIEGKLDMTRLFRPKFDLTLNGEELYIRTPLSEQEGIVNADIYITGKDTINIEGVANVDQFIVRNEFTGKRSKLADQKKERKIHNKINLQVYAPGHLYVRNSQLECELEGEIFLLKEDTDPLDLSGSLDVIDGDFYYYGWQFSNLTGPIVFDPNEDYPELTIQADLYLSGYSDASATTGTTSDSEDETVTVYLTGELDNPSLQFESTKYSQSDILRILTRTSGVDDNGLSENTLSSGALNIFGSYFERQLERNISRISGLDEFQIRTQGDLFSARNTDQWSVVLGQKVATNLYITYERNFSLVDPNQQIGIEYRLNRFNSIGGDIDEDGLIHINYKFKFQY